MWRWSTHKTNVFLKNNYIFNHYLHYIHFIYNSFMVTTQCIIINCHINFNFSSNCCSCCCCCRCHWCFWCFWLGCLSYHCIGSSNNRSSTCCLRSISICLSRSSSSRLITSYGRGCAGCGCCCTSGCCGCGSRSSWSGCGSWSIEMKSVEPAWIQVTVVWILNWPRSLIS